MPPALDLTGRRFGKFTVLRADGRMKFGREMTAWLCRCDCGTEERVAQKRLTAKTGSSQKHACDACRAIPCEICEAPVALAAKAKTCSAECAAERERRYQLAYYHDVRTTDPDDIQKRAARARARWIALSPEEKLADGRKRAAGEDRERVNARAREAHARRMATDPDYAERRRLRNAVRRARDPERAREYSRTSAQKRRAERVERGLMEAIAALQLRDDQNDQ